MLLCVSSLVGLPVVRKLPTVSQFVNRKDVKLFYRLVFEPVLVTWAVGLVW